ncbi:hypothetical protein HO173_009684 [Letharia columbiana]|uniref:NAD(P)-binding protein n=1 Tax=Letharia columbiana TaxID=112416 RepID=A0A8H6FP15_9LECA|nr:uncharacterized protein HO173_009684 [Letharia columbiana]KAF6232090.1 hypothetical protein HO173_009684 [Letharia columbiana]
MEGRKTVLITGCSPGGIGYALATQFQSKGLHVFATARNEKAVTDLKALGVEALQLEVTSPESVAEVKRHISERTNGSLDYLVNNAGRNYTIPALDVDLSEVQATFETNVFSVMRMCQAFAPLLIQAKGTIVQIGSVAAVIPYVFGSAYNASKAALHAYSDTLRVELAPFDVNVMVVVTGGVKSNIASIRRELPEGSLYHPLKIEYERRQKHSQEGATESTVYAEGVVRAALGSKPARSLWRGHQAWSVWLLLTLMPRMFWDYYFTRVFNLTKLGYFVKAQRKKL